MFNKYIIHNETVMMCSLCPPPSWKHQMFPRQPFEVFSPPAPMLWWLQHADCCLFFILIEVLVGLTRSDTLTAGGGIDSTGWREAAWSQMTNSNRRCLSTYRSSYWWRCDQMCPNLFSEPLCALRKYRFTNRLILSHQNTKSVPCFMVSP